MALLVGNENGPLESEGTSSNSILVALSKSSKPSIRDRKAAGFRRANRRYHSLTVTLDAGVRSVFVVEVFLVEVVVVCFCFCFCFLPVFRAEAIAFGGTVVDGKVVDGRVVSEELLWLPLDLEVKA